MILFIYYRGIVSEVYLGMGAWRSEGQQSWECSAAQAHSHRNRFEGIVNDQFTWDKINNIQIRICHLHCVSTSSRQNHFLRRIMHCRWVLQTAIIAIHHKFSFLLSGPKSLIIDNTIWFFNLLFIRLTWGIVWLVVQW